MFNTNPIQDFVKVNEYYFMQKAARQKKPDIAGFLSRFFLQLADRNTNIFKDFNRPRNPRTVKKIVQDILGVKQNSIGKVMNLMVDSKEIEILSAYEVRINLNLANKQPKNIYPGRYFRENVMIPDCQIIDKIIALEQKKRRKKEDTELDKALDIIGNLTATNASMLKTINTLAEAFQNLTHEEKEALPPALNLIASNGELVK